MMFYKVHFKCKRGFESIEVMASSPADAYSLAKSGLKNVERLLVDTDPVVG